jgi:hypothetical protein
VTQLEKDWLKYAWNVLGDDPLKCCTGTCDRFGRVMRWPGYLGPRYQESRGVLFVGAVHNANNQDSDHKAGQLFTSHINKLAGIACDWLSGAVTDADYLSVVRSAYEKSQAQWKTVWRHFRTLQTLLKVSFDQTAFTNLAKCFLTPHKSAGKPTGKDTDDLFVECNDKFPLYDLIRILKPAMVFVAKDSGTSHKVFHCYPYISGPAIYMFHNLNGTNSRGESIKQWGLRAAAWRALVLGPE